MLVNKNLKEVENLIQPIIENLGLFYVDIELRNTHDNLTLIVYIDKKEGITINDCELVSKAIDLPLDDIDFTNGQSYNLNVSSPGLDRALKKDIDFERNLEKEIEVKFFVAFVDNKKVITGKLLSFDKEEFTIEYDNKELIINKKLTTVIKPVIKF